MCINIQYIPRNMHTVFALLCFVVVIHWLISPYPSGLLHWHCDNLTIAPVPAKQPWWIWINTSCELIMNDCITTTKQSTTKPCAYFLGYTVSWVIGDMRMMFISVEDNNSYIARSMAGDGLVPQCKKFSSLPARTICSINKSIWWRFETLISRHGKSHDVLLSFIYLSLFSGRPLDIGTNITKIQLCNDIDEYRDSTRS